MPFHRVRDPERLQALIDAMLVVATDIDVTVVLRAIAQKAVDLVGARFGAIGVLDATRTGLAEFITVGMDAELVSSIGHLPEGRGILGLLIEDPRPLRLDDLGDHPERAGFPDGHPPMRSFLGVPITVGGEAYGNLYLCEKEGDGGFTEEDEDIVAALGLASGLAIDKARLYARLRELTLAEERERIARDLHAHVIQRLFTVGLTLQGALRLEGRVGWQDRLQESIDELDETIRQIRSTVFSMTRPLRLAGSSVRGDVLALVDAATYGAGVQTTVDLDGPIDELGPQSVDVLLVTLREVLADVVRHAGAGAVGVEVQATEGGLQLRVTDDGTRRNAAEDDEVLAMVRERAKLLGGSCERQPGPAGGSELTWRVRLRAAGGMPQ